VISELRDMLIRHEGVKLKPYRDSVGKLTIGCGRNLDDVGISDLEAFMLLNNDISRVDTALKKEFAWYQRIGEKRQIVVANMAFNMGVAGIKGFTQMIEAIKRQDWEDAAKQMLSSKWAGQVGKRAVELAEKMRSGV
jgi:lysozyme